MLFYVWEDARVWSQRGCSLHTQLSYLGPVSRFSHLELLGAHCREWPQLTALGWQVFFPFLRALEFTSGGPEQLMTVTSLFTDVAGNTPFLIPLYQSQGLAYEN